MRSRFRSPSPGAGVLAAAALLTGGALLIAACTGDEGTPPPAAAFLPDEPAPPDQYVTLQAGTISGTMAELIVRVKNVQNVQAASFDLAFGTKRCAAMGAAGSQNACLTDPDCPAGETCLPSVDPVVRFVTGSADATGSLLDCGLPGTLKVEVVPDPDVTDQLIVGLSRFSFRACSSGTACTFDTDCPAGELCGSGELCDPDPPEVPLPRCCVSVEPCPLGTECFLPDQCETRVCDFGAGSGTGDVLLRLTFEILDRGRVRVDFVSPAELQDSAGTTIPATFSGGILEGV